MSGGKYYEFMTISRHRQVDCGPSSYSGSGYHRIALTRRSPLNPPISHRGPKSTIVPRHVGSARLSGMDPGRHGNTRGPVAVTRQAEDPMRNAMDNKISSRNSRLLALSTVCLGIAAFGCSKSDSLGSVRDGGTDGIGKDGNSNAPDGEVCGAGVPVHYSAPGCGADAVPICGATSQECLSLDSFCGCDGQTTVYGVCRTSPSPFLYVGACPDGGPGPLDLLSDSGGDGGGSSGTYQCQVNADGTCSAVTPDTSCLPLRGVPFDQQADCLSGPEITLACAAWQTGTMGGLAAAEGCYQVPQDGGALVYRTDESDISDPLWRSRVCDASLAALVSGAPACGSAPEVGR